MLPTFTTGLLGAEADAVCSARNTAQITWIGVSRLNGLLLPRVAVAAPQAGRSGGDQSGGYLLGDSARRMDTLVAAAGDQDAV